MLLGTALEQGWVAMDLEQWIRAGGPAGRVLIIRHDVDQHPATAVRMAELDARHGVRGTWYFRWRTSSPAAIERVRALGGTIGFHYETLTRLVRARGIVPEAIDEELIAQARAELAGEVQAFQRHLGPIRSVCAHGDTRVPGVTNQVLVHGIDPVSLGVEFDANEAISRHRLGLWMTDRALSDGGWKDAIDPLEVIRTGEDPVLCLTHPNNWCSGASLWADRLRAALLPTPRLSRRARPWLGVRTGSDRPPDTGGSPEPGPARGQQAPAALAGAIDASLRRAIVRYHHDHGGGLSVSAGQRMLEEGPLAAASAQARLERLLAEAGIDSLVGLELLELGAGFGDLALRLAARGARVTAVELDAGRLSVVEQVAGEHGLPVRGLSRLEQLPERAFSITLLGAAPTAGALPEPEAFAAAHRALADHGLLVLANGTGRREERERALRDAGFVEIRRAAGAIVATRPRSA